MYICASIARVSVHMCTECRRRGRANETGPAFATAFDRGYPYGTSVEPHRSRNLTTLLMPSPMPYTSTCNALAVATSLVVRGLLAKRCGVRPLDVSPRRIHRLMFVTALYVWDPATLQRLPVVRPRALYELCRTVPCGEVTPATA